MSDLPQWPIDFANFGRTVYEASKSKTCQPFTFVLCMPRIEFAALLIGAGIISKYLAETESLSDQERIKEFVGSGVIFDSEKYGKIAGYLEYCEITKEYKICQYNKVSKKSSKPGHSVTRKLVLRKQDWSSVRPVDRQIPRERLLGQAKIDIISRRMSAIENLGPIFGFNRDPASNKASCLFTIIGNKTRLLYELSEDLQPPKDSSLLGILRPQGIKSELSGWCAIESFGAELNENNSILILESSRNLGDLLLASKSRNRVILLGRNVASYEECANLVLDNFSKRKNEIKELDISLPATVQPLAFYQA